MAKSKSKYLPLYMKERRRIQQIIYRQRKAGFIVDYQLPTIPTKITKKELTKLQKITPSVVRKKSSYISPTTGAILSAEETFKKRRSESAKKSAQTRKRNRESFEKFAGLEAVYLEDFEPEPYIEEPEIPKTQRLADESNLPGNIQWDSNANVYVDYLTGEIIEPDKLPDARPIVMENYLKEMGEQILPTDFFNDLIQMLEGEVDDTTAWYSRRAVSRAKSTAAKEKLAQKLRELITNKQANKKYYRNLMEAGKKDELMTAINDVIYGYSESDINTGYSRAIQILFGDDSIMSAAEYSEADDEDDSDW